MPAVRSMTAFSREEAAYPWGQVIWEVRSVNHRYLDCHFRLPDTMRSIEGHLREVLRKHLFRGKVDCSLQLQLESVQQGMEVDSAMLDQYLSAIELIDKRSGHASATPGIELLFRPGVIKQKSLDSDVLNAAVKEVFDRALREHILHREREGSALVDLLNARLHSIAEHVEIVRPMIPLVLQQQKEKMHARLADIKEQLDDSRLEQEMAIMAQKIDVAEELDRLETHLQEVRRALKSGENIGRRLDFLMQELNREANTLSSKSISSDTTLKAVDIKVLIEQMREQVQNIE